MKKLLLSFMLLASYISHAQQKPVITDETRFNKCVTENTTYFSFNGQAPIGKGWEVLQGLFAENQFVAWGEYHNSPLLSQLTGFALEAAASKGYRTWCTETSPFAASELMRIAKMPNPFDTIASFSKTNHITPTFPFFESRQDIDMLQVAAKLNYTIWGIDQEFQLTFPYCINKIYDGLPARRKAQYKPVRDSLLAKWWMPDAKLLDSLYRVVKRPALKQLINDVALSRDIYNNSDNRQRATLMKRNFFNYYDTLKNKGEKIFFKMGNNHLARGMNLETHLYDIGNAVYELAEHNRTGFANVYFMVRYTNDKGTIVDDLESAENENPKVFSKLYNKDKWVLIDVRSLRTRIKYDGSLTTDTYRLIEKYDMVVISPEVL